ncbi:MAG: hypothetical protein JO331_03050 [Verrucomicrobia bacterium]|nr:hypothetical protein [Verrucomicrobiota bacterium]
MDGSYGKHLLSEHFRYAKNLLPTVSLDHGLPRETEFLQTNSHDGYSEQSISGLLPLESWQLKVDGTSVQLATNPMQVVNTLRLEKYAVGFKGRKPVGMNHAVRNTYYFLRPLMPVMMRKHLQRAYLQGWDKVPFPRWPVDSTVDDIFEHLLVRTMKSQDVSEIPFIWFWPDGAHSCAIMTHDVETARGFRFCPKLMDLNDSFAIKSSFQIVPEKRYKVSNELLAEIRNRGFEINIHDLNHDGHLFSNYTEFLRRAERINEYKKLFGAEGFRSALLYRNVDWYDALDFSYDMSIPNVAHLDPQQGGCCTVTPFFIGNTVELPVTTIQDYSLFHVLNDYSTQIWQRQIALIRSKHGLMNFIVHPDYIIAAKARRVYWELLSYLAELRSQGETWIGLPREVAAWWRMRSKMHLVNRAGSWRIEGKGSDRAKIAYATLANDRIVYKVD